MYKLSVGMSSAKKHACAVECCFWVERFPGGETPAPPEDDWCRRVTGAWGARFGRVPRCP